MYNKNLLSSCDNVPFIVVKNEEIGEVNWQSLDMTEFTCEELIKCNIEDIFRRLRVGPNVDIDKIDVRTEYFLFTKSLEVKFVSIKVIQKEEEKIYVF
ncbi:hypothetical protein [Clostridium thailandense]|uniref:hypothetical protein n=1 Tax=Clostridium thailandense TaxID=2794346 RepID=UPI003989EF3D